MDGIEFFVRSTGDGRTGDNDVMATVGRATILLASDGTRAWAKGVVDGLNSFDREDMIALRDALIAALDAGEGE